MHRMGEGNVAVNMHGSREFLPSSKRHRGIDDSQSPGIYSPEVDEYSTDEPGAAAEYECPGIEV